MSPTSPAVDAGVCRWRRHQCHAASEMFGVPVEYAVGGAPPRQGESISVSFTAYRPLVWPISFSIERLRKPATISANISNAFRLIKRLHGGHPKAEAKAAWLVTIFGAGPHYPEIPSRQNPQVRAFKRTRRDHAPIQGLGRPMSSAARWCGWNRRSKGQARKRRILLQQVHGRTDLEAAEGRRRKYHLR